MHVEHQVVEGIELDVLARCRVIATATWSDALDAMNIVGVLSGLERRSGNERTAGRAVTIIEEVGTHGEFELSDFAIGEVLELAGPGDTVFASVGGGAAVSTLGGLAARRARARGIEAVIIDGGCRDIEELRAVGLFVASRHVTPVSGKTRLRVVALNLATASGDVTISPGDLIVSDETGTVVVPRARVPEALELAESLAEKDAVFAARLDGGKSFTNTAVDLQHC